MIMKDKMRKRKGPLREILKGMGMEEQRKKTKYHVSWRKKEEKAGERRR